MRFASSITFFLIFFVAGAQQPDSAYHQLKASLVTKFAKTKAGTFGTIVKGVASAAVTEKKIVILTLDACGGRTGSAYDVDLIDYLKEQKIPATLFISGSWADVHPDLVRKLSRDSLFEIESHGLTHRPCSITGQSRYSIRGTKDVGEVVDEIEMNARKIEHITGRKPIYYRSGTATTDEACAQIASELNSTIVSFDVLSEDAVADTPAEHIKNSVLKNLHPGAIIIMHMNRPQWNGFEALKEIIPKVQEQGYSFVLLQHHNLLLKH